jgi:protein-S-isoprenylcysteine O-methyltransferase Ste14
MSEGREKVLPLMEGGGSRGRETMSLMDRCLLVKPTVRMLIDWPVMIGVGILGLVFSVGRMDFYPFINLMGGTLLLGGCAIHEYCHRTHRQAHEESKKIDSLVTSGPYSIVRHPMYASLMAMRFGAAFAFGIVWVLVPATAFSALDVLTALKEEEFLVKKFGVAYEEYVRAVPYRFVPKIV